MKLKEVYIVAATRTPIGSFGGVLKSIPATKLGAIAIKGALGQAGLQPAHVEEVFMGHVLQAGVGQAPARQAAIFAGLPETVVATTVNKVCASGMKAIMLGAQSILAGDRDIVVAGGMESMSNAPFYLQSMRWGNKYGHAPATDAIVKDGLTDVYNDSLMGNAAELCAETCQISRAMQDDFTIESYKRSQAAWEKGLFEGEITPVPVPQRKGEPVLVDKDEEPFKVNFEKIPGLKPVFKLDGTGTVTAANASTINDGAAALVLMSAEKAMEMGIQPLAVIRSYSDAAQAPEWFTTSPALAIPLAVTKAGLKMKDLDFVELNEAFAVVGLVNTQQLGLDAKKVNVHGGAVSLGHPLGCSGARIIVTLLNVLKKQGGKIGAAGICNGGGGASAMVIELA